MILWNIKRMNKFYLSLLILMIISIITSCNSSSSSSSSSWQSTGNSFSAPDIAFNSIAVSSSGTVYVGGSANVNNGLVLDNPTDSSNWQRVANNYTPGYPGQIGALAVSSTNTLLCAASNTIHSSTNSTLMCINPNESASVWQTITFFDDMLLGNNEIINSLAIDNTNTVYATVEGNIYSTPITGFVLPKKIGLGSAPDGGMMNTVLVESSTVYAAAGGYKIDSDGSPSYFGNVYSADSSGSHAWQQIGSMGTPDNGVANSIVLSGDKSNIYVATSKGNVYRSSVESGGAWSIALGGKAVPDDGAINSITIANNGTVFVATTLGNVYNLTQDNHWQQIGGGTVPDNWSINAIAVYGTQLYVATQGGHVYTIIFP